MPRLAKRIPKYRKHKATGQAVVTIDGHDFYLGPHGSRPSRREYERLVGEWLQNDRSLLAGPETVSMAELLNAYRKFSAGYYVKSGRPTGAIHGIRAMLKLVRRHYGDARVVEFGPLALKTLQTQMIEAGLSRRYINDHTQRIRRMFKWAAGNEMIPFECYQRLTAVEGLQKGRTGARETPPVLPIADDIIDLTLPHLPAVVADMVRMQRLTGCRPGETCVLRPADVDITGEVWGYRPATHKTEHLGRERVIMIGPKAQVILRPYLLRPAEAYCFSPAESERARLQDRHRRRVTQLNYGNRPGTNRRRKRKRAPGTHYTSDSYRQAVHRACDKAFPPPNDLTPSKLKAWRAKHRWSPNQLRHTVATSISQQFGLEAAQVTLGHTNANVTQIYAERDLNKAAAIMLRVG